MVKAFIFVNSIARRLKLINSLTMENKMQIVGISDEYELALTSIFKLKPDVLIHYGDVGKGPVLEKLRKIREMNPEIKIIILTDEPDCAGEEIYRDKVINFHAGAGEMSQVNSFIFGCTEGSIH